MAPGAVALADCWVFLGEIQRIRQAARREHVKCALRETVHRRHLTARVQIAAQPIKAAQEAPAVLELVER
jgi:hypothetical protein